MATAVAVGESIAFHADAVKGIDVIRLVHP